MIVDLIFWRVWLTYLISLVGRNIEWNLKFTSFIGLIRLNHQFEIKFLRIRNKFALFNSSIVVWDRENKRMQDIRKNQQIIHSLRIKWLLTRPHLFYQVLPMLLDQLVIASSLERRYNLVKWHFHAWNVSIFHPMVFQI